MRIRRTLSLFVGAALVIAAGLGDAKNLDAEQNYRIGGDLVPSDQLGDFPHAHVREWAKGRRQPHDLPLGRIVRIVPWRVAVDLESIAVVVSQERHQMTPNRVAAEIRGQQTDA